MEIARLRIAFEQLQNAIVVIYSLGVMATILPTLPSASSVIALPYFLFVPGYFVTLVLHRSASFLEKLFYAFAWSIAILAAVHSIETISPIAIFPPNVIIPVITILLLIYVHFHSSRLNGA